MSLVQRCPYFRVSFKRGSTVFRCTKIIEYSGGLGMRLSESDDEPTIGALLGQQESLQLLDLSLFLLHLHPQGLHLLYTAGHHQHCLLAHVVMGCVGGT